MMTATTIMTMAMVATTMGSDHANGDGNIGRIVTTITSSLMIHMLVVNVDCYDGGHDN